LKNRALVKLKARKGVFTGDDIVWNNYVGKKIMLKITPDNLYLAKPSVIIANFPVDGDPRDNFEDGTNTIVWTVMQITGSGYKLETCFPNFSTTARDLKEGKDLVNGRWWIFELKDLQHHK
jgi:hypothetical protein